MDIGLVFTPYTTSVLLLLRWEGGLLGCKHKLHLCMLGTNSTLIKSDGLPNSLLQRPAVVIVLMFSCSAVLWGAASALAVGFLGSCGTQPAFLMSQPTSLFTYSPLLFWRCGGGRYKPFGYVWYGWALLEEVHSDAAICYKPRTDQKGWGQRNFL